MEPKVLFYSILFYSILFYSLESNAQQATLAWSQAVNCQEVVEDDPRKSINFADISPSDCIRFCENSKVTYNLDVDGPLPTISWQVTGGSIIGSSVSDACTIQWGAAGSGSIQISLTNGNTVVTKNLCIEKINTPNPMFFIPPFSVDDMQMTICANQAVSFVNQSLNNGGADIWYYNWSFINTNNPEASIITSTEQNPTHTYTQAGIYTVNFTITNACGCSNSTERTIEIIDGGFDILCPSVVCEGQMVTYNLPENIASLCNENPEAWGIPDVEQENIFLSEDQKSVQVVWHNIDESGFGTVIYHLDACETGCTLESIVRVPVIQTNGTIQGTTEICATEQYKYSLPQWPSTIVTWSLTNQSGEQFPVLTSDQPNEGFVTVPTAGIYTLHATYYNTLINCGGNAELVLHAKANTPIITGEQNLCLNDQNQAYATYTIFITDENGEQIQPPTALWNVKNAQGTIIFSEETEEFNVTYLAAGNYTVTASAENYCKTASFPVTVYAKPATPVGTLKQIANNGDLINIEKVCPDVVYTYTVESTNELPSNLEHNWSVENCSMIGINNGTSVQIKVPMATFISGLTPKIYLKYKLKNAPYCESATKLFEIPKLLINGSLSGDAIVCSSTNHTYSFTNLLDSANELYDNPDSYEWTINPAYSGSVVEGQGTANPTILWNNSTVNNNPTLHLKVVKCGVTYNYAKPITITQNLSFALAANNANVCSGTNVSFTLSPLNNVNINSFDSIVWDFGDGTTVTNNQFVTNHTFINIDSNATNIVTRTVTATIVSPNGCNNSIVAINVNILPAPLINISPSGLLTISSSDFTQPIQVVASTQSSSALTWQWYKFDESMNPVIIPNATTPIYYIPASEYGFYYATATNIHGCIGNSHVLHVKSPDGISPPPCTLNPLQDINTQISNNACGSVNILGNYTSNGGITPNYYQWSFSPNTYQNGTLEAQDINFIKWKIDIAGIYPYTYKVGYPNAEVESCVVKENYTLIVPYVTKLNQTISCTNNTAYTINVIDYSSKLPYMNITRTLTHNGIPVNFTNGDTFTFTAQPNTQHTFVLTLSTPGYANCSKQLVINTPPLPNANFTITPRHCKAEHILLTPQVQNPAEFTYLWSFSGQGNPTNTQMICPKEYASIPDNPTVTLTVTNKYGCSITSTQPINPINYYLPTENIRGNVVNILNQQNSNPEICEGTSVKIQYALLSGQSNPASYKWMNGTEVIGVTNHPTNFIMVSESGSYWCKSYTGPNATGCEYDKMPTRINVAVVPKATLSLAGPTTVCTGNSITLTASINSATPPLNYTWNIQGWATITTTEPKLYLDSSYTYNAGEELIIAVTANFTSGISACGTLQANKIIIVADQPAEPEITMELVSCDPYFIKLSANDGYASYNWSNGTTGQSITVNQGGAYAVTVKNENSDCTAMAQVDVPKDPQIYMWYFPKGCYTFCNTRDNANVHTITPTIPAFDKWDWLLNGEVLQSIEETPSPIAPLATDLQNGTYQWNLEYWHCMRTTAPASIQLFDNDFCKGNETCDFTFDLRNTTVDATEDGCFFTLDITIDNPFSTPLGYQFFDEESSVVVSPSSVTVQPGSSSIPLQLHVFPLENFDSTINFVVQGSRVNEKGDTEICVKEQPMLLQCTPGVQARANSKKPAVTTDARMFLAPNPAQHTTDVFYSFTEAQPTKLQVFDLTGRVVYTENLTQKQGISTLDVSNWQTGIYLVQLSDENQVLKTQKLIKN